MTWSSRVPLVALFLTCVACSGSTVDGQGGGAAAAGASGTGATGGSGAAGGTAGATSGGSGGVGGSGNAGGQAGTGGSGGTACNAKCGAPGCPPCEGAAMVGTTMADGTAYRIDSTEVTNAQYAQFISASVDPSTQPADCTWNTSFAPDISNGGCTAAIEDPVKRANYPVVCVDWCDARAYCEWAGKRLCLGKGGAPTNGEESGEWSSACSAQFTRKFPYGDTYDPTACNGKDLAAGGLVEVGSLPGCEGGIPGVFDMSGNVEEWVGSCAGAGADAQCRSSGGSNELCTRPTSSVPQAGHSCPVARNERSGLPMLRGSASLTPGQLAFWSAIATLCAGCGGHVDTGTGGQAGAGSCVDTSSCSTPDSGLDSGADGTAIDEGGHDATLDNANEVGTDAGGDASPDADAASCMPIDGTVGPCDPIAKCGCPPGQACDNPESVLDAGNIIPITACRQTGTIAAFAGPCQFDEDCAAGLACVYGACYPYCVHDSDCPGADPYRTCLQLGPYRPYGVCTRQCDPVDPSRSGGGFYPCGPGGRCEPAYEQLPGLKPGQTECGPWVTEPPVAPGAACDDSEAATRCDLGYLCAPPDDGSGKAGCDAAFCAGVCRRWCRVGENGCNGNPCVPTGLYAGPTELGLCP